MRLAGTLTDQHDAATLVDYLLTIGIGAKPEQNGAVWELWILDEDRVADAKRELAEFQVDPQAEKYRAAAKEADRLRREKVDKALQARRNQITLSPRTASGRRPVTMLLLAASAVVFVVSDFGQKLDGVRKLQISQIHRVEGGAGAYYHGLPDVQRGEVWRVVTPMFVHMDIWHFVFNMYMLVVLGSEIESRRGSLVYALLVLLASVACNLAEYLWSGPNFGGMSGVNYGLFGYMLIKSRYQPWLGLALQPGTTFMLIAWLFLCMTGVMGPVANAGHVGGLTAGIVFAAVPTFFARRR